MGKPLISFRNKGIEIAAWEFKGNQVNFTLRKTYKNKETQQWQETKTYFVDDLRNLRELVNQALSWMEQQPDVAPSAAAQKILNAAVPAPATTLDDDDIPF